MGYLPLVLFILPVLAASISFFRSESISLLSGLLALIQWVLSGVAAYLVFIESETLGESGEWLRLDPLNTFFVFCLSLFALIGVFYEQIHWSLLPVESDAFDNQVKLRRLLWLWAAANASMLVYGLVSMWLGFLVLLICLSHLYQSEDSEMKQLSLRGWVALSLSLIGCALFFWSSIKAGVTENYFSFDSLLRAASSLDDTLILAGTFFLLAGFGFFAGLWPSQSLLLPLYQKLSAPKAFFYATALWSTSLYAVLRVVGLGSKATGMDAVHPILLLLGFLTLLISVLALQKEDNIKAFLGYWMTYHTGALLFSLGFAARFTAQTVVFSLFLTVLSHGLLWLSLGVASTPKQITTFSSLKLSSVGGRRLLLLAFAVAIGLPPFGTFLSQWMSFHSIAIEHHQWYSNEKINGFFGAVWMFLLYWRLWFWLFCLVLALVAIFRVGLQVLHNPPDEIATRPIPRGVYYLFAAMLLLVLVPGLFVPELLDELFDQLASQVVGEWSGSL